MIECGGCHQTERSTVPVREWRCPRCGWSLKDRTRAAVASRTAIEQAVAVTPDTSPAEEHDVAPPEKHDADSLTSEVERIHAEAGNLARRRRPDRLVISTLKRDLSKIRKHIDSVVDPRRRTRLARLAEKAHQRLLDTEATLAARAERDERRAGTIHPPPSDHDLHRRIGPVQRYDDET
jgi:hypothetical protein